MYLTLQYNTNSETAEKLKSCSHIIVEDIDPAVLASPPPISFAASAVTATSGANTAAAAAANAASILASSIASSSLYSAVTNSANATQSASSITASAPLSPSSSMTALASSPQRRFGGPASTPSSTSPTAFSKYSNYDTIGIVAVNITILNDIWRQVTDPPTARRKSRKGGKHRGIRPGSVESETNFETPAEESDAERKKIAESEEDKSQEQLHAEPEKESETGEEDDEASDDPSARLICFSTENLSQSTTLTKSTDSCLSPIGETKSESDVNENSATSTTNVTTTTVTTATTTANDNDNNVSTTTTDEPPLEPFVPVPIPDDLDLNPSLTPIYYKAISRGKKPLKEAAEMTLSQFKQACDLLLNPGDISKVRT